MSTETAQQAKIREYTENKVANLQCQLGLGFTKKTFNAIKSSMCHCTHSQKLEVKIETLNHEIAGHKGHTTVLTKENERLSKENKSLLEENNILQGQLRALIGL